MFGFFKRKKQKEIEILRTLMSAAAEGEQRAKINAAIGSLGIQLPPENDNTKYCINTCAVIVRNIMESYGTKPEDANDDDIFTAGLFLFTVSNHITRIVGAPFETVASVTPLELFSATRSPLEMAEYVHLIGNLYNDTMDNGRVCEAIGQSLAKWIMFPTHEQFDKLIQLYRLCRENISEK